MDPFILSDELQIALQAYSATTDSICDSLTRQLDFAPPPATVYHYTDDRGLRGILCSGQLWFTDLFDLNDPSELIHGIGHALTLLKSKTDGGPPEAQRFYQIFDEVMTGNAKSIAYNFIFCFSKASDDLGQWRAYADDGRGYAIGFDTTTLETAFKESEILAIQKHQACAEGWLR